MFDSKIRMTSSSTPSLLLLLLLLLLVLLIFVEEWSWLCTVFLISDTCNGPLKDVTVATLLQHHKTLAITRCNGFSKNKKTAIFCFESIESKIKFCLAHFSFIIISYCRPCTATVVNNTYRCYYRMASNVSLFISLLYCIYYRYF